MSPASGLYCFMFIWLAVPNFLPFYPGIYKRRGRGGTSENALPSFQLLHCKQASGFLCLWFCASLTCINNCPMTCNTKQSIYYSASHSTCFGCQPHPSSGVHKTVTTASGTGRIFLCSYLPSTWPTWFKAPPGTTSSSITTHTPSGQRNCALWASQPQKSVTLLPCPGGRTTKSTKDMWWH